MSKPARRSQRADRPHWRVELKAALFATGKEQRAIARAARMDAATLSHLVRGRRDPTPQQAADLARVLKRKVADLFPELARRRRRRAATSSVATPTAAPAA